MLGKIFNFALLGISALFIGYKIIKTTKRRNKYVTNNCRFTKMEPKVKELLIKDRINRQPREWQDWKLSSDQQDSIYSETSTKDALRIWHVPLPGLFEMSSLFFGPLYYKNIHLSGCMDGFNPKQFFSIIIKRDSDNLSISITINKTFIEEDDFPFVTDILESRISTVSNAVNRWITSLGSNVVAKKPITKAIGGNTFLILEVSLPLPEHHSCSFSDLQSAGVVNFD